MRSLWLHLLVLVILHSFSRTETSSGEYDPFVGESKPHTNNWAVLVCTSAFWFNYRHTANTLAVYKHAKRLGIPDDHIILMLADDMACNGRNQYQGQVFGGTDLSMNVYGEDIEVDYRGCEVTVEMFIRLLTNRLPDYIPQSKRLLTDEGSNILIYMTGHGGDNFLKFQDSEEINTYDLADAFSQMKERNRYREILFIIDTCQANTMYERFRSPDIFAIASSMRGESSYSYNVVDEVGVALIDRFTYSLLKFLKDLDIHSEKTVADFMDSLDVHFLGAAPDTRGDLFNRPMNAIKLLDFFGNIRQVVNTVPKMDPRWFIPFPDEKISEFVELKDTLQMPKQYGKSYPKYEAFNIRKLGKPSATEAFAPMAALFTSAAAMLFASIMIF